MSVIEESKEASEFKLTDLKSHTGKDGHPYYVIGTLSLGGKDLEVSIRMWFSSTEKNQAGPTQIGYRVRFGSPTRDGVKATFSDQEFGQIVPAAWHWSPITTVGQDYRSLQGSMVIGKYPAPVLAFCDQVLADGGFDAILQGISSMTPQTAKVQWVREYQDIVHALYMMVYVALGPIPELVNLHRCEVTLCSAAAYHYLNGKVLRTPPEAAPLLTAAKANQQASPTKQPKPQVPQVKKPEPKAAPKTKAKQLAPGLTADDIGL